MYIAVLFAYLALLNCDWSCFQTWWLYAYRALISSYMHAFSLYPHDLSRSSIVNPHVWSYRNSLHIHTSPAWSLYAIPLQDTCKFKFVHSCLINRYMLCYITTRRFLNVPLPWMNATPLFISPLIVDHVCLRYCQLLLHLSCLINLYIPPAACLMFAC